MLRLVQPGGVSRQMCVQHTARHKLALLTMAKHLQDEEGISLRKSAEHVQVSAGLLVKWKERFSLGNNPIEALLKTKKKSIHPGPLGQFFKPLEEALLKYIFEQREQGIKVSTLSIVVVASNIFIKFGKKNFIARCSAVKRFVRAHSLVYQIGTHLCQHKPEEVETEANYMRLICTLLFGPHCYRRFILNMDQMPIYFLMSTKRLLELVE
jgi:hypothetical protein